MNNSCEFTKKYTKDERLQKVKFMKDKFPHKIPIVVIFSKDLTYSDKQFLVDSQQSLGEFISILRKSHITNIKSSDAIFCLINNTLHPLYETLGSLYLDNALDDQILYIHIKKESTFG